MSSKLILSLILTVITGHLCNAQMANFDWAKSIGGTDSDNGSSIAVDPLGNTYITGHFQDTVDFDPGPGVYNLSSTSLAIYIQKLDVNGDFLWVKSFAENTSGASAAVKLDYSGNIYITGYFEGTVDFDPSSSIANLTAKGSSELFILKLDTNGNFVWAKSTEGTSNSGIIGNGLAVDSLNNIYITGSFFDTIDFDPGPGNQIYTTTGMTNIFVVDRNIFIQKLDSNGNFVWAKSIGNTDEEIATAIAVDYQGNTYTTGLFKGTIDFDPGVGVSNLVSNGSKDIFIQKLDANGNFVWAKSMGSTSYNDEAYAITLDAQGNIYTTGFFSGTVDFDPGIGVHNIVAGGVIDLFVQKLDANGNFIWAKATTGSSITTGGSTTTSIVGHSITVDNQGNVYTIGKFKETIDFDPSTGGVYNLTANGLFDIFIQKLDMNGNLLWADNIGGSNWDIGLGIEVDHQGNIYSTGVFKDVVDFDPSTNSSTLSSNGNYDIFILQLSQPNFTTTSLIDNASWQVQTFPNPTTGQLTIVLEEEQRKLSLRLYSVSGQLLEEKQLENTQQSSLKINNPAGIYFVELLNEKGERSVLSVIKE